MTTKAKYIEDAAGVIDGRVAALEEEYERVWKAKGGRSAATERSAISEAKHCAALIRSLMNGRYGKEPYEFAKNEWSHGRANPKD
jgi:predicted fused transcriptional regulator/phosphomethylpyrimidine kinase